MPTPTETIEQMIDPLPEDVAEIEALEGNVVHISGAETITGLKTFTQPIHAEGGIVGSISGTIAAGTVLEGDLDLNGFALLNLGGSGLEVLANKGVANGYAPLGADGLVPADYLGTGGAGAGDNFLADDGTFKPISAGSVSFGTQLANRVFAGPGSGGAAVPGFRVMVAADVPTLPQSKITNLVTDLAGKVPITRTITEGNGLAGNIHDLSDDLTLEMGTPSALGVDSIDIADGPTHSHSIDSSANPGATASILATDGSGYLTLLRLTLTDRLLINALTANLYLKDTSTGLQSATTGIITPQTGNVFRSTTYTSGIRGWNVDDDGNAEFNNIRVRGEIAASVFKVNEISAAAGTLGVFYSAANLNADVTTPASTSSSFSFEAKNSDAGGMLFAVGDIVRFKAWTGAGVADSWATITARVNHTTYTTYTATLNNGSTSATFRAGTAVVDYGPSGTGYITLSADGTIGSSPNLTMATHAGSPWSAQTTLLRLGNLNGSYGYATNVYGLGMGNYGTSDSWLTLDPTDGLQIFGGNGDVQLTGLGLIFNTPTLQKSTAAVRWNDGTHDTALVASYYEPTVENGIIIRADTYVGDDDARNIATVTVNNTGGNTDISLFQKSLNAGGGSSVDIRGTTLNGVRIGTSASLVTAGTTPSHMLDVYGTGWFQGAVTFAGGITQDAWTAPALLNSWVNFGAPQQVAGYRKDAQGRVWLRGTIKGGTKTVGTTILTLPSGYRPSATKLYVVDAPGFGAVSVDSSGDIKIDTEPSANTYLSLEFSFPMD